MRNRLKILSVILCFVFCLSMFVFSVSAEDENLENGTDSVSSTDITEEESTDFSEEESSETEDTTGENEESTSESEPSEDINTEPEPVDTESVESDPNEYEEPYEYTDEPDYYPEDDNIASNEIETLSIGKNDSDFDDIMTDSDWQQLRLSLSENSAEEVGDEFSIIKNNTSSEKDDGGWILIVGIALVAASVVCLAVFIVFTRKASELKKMLGAPSHNRVRSKRENDDYGDSYSSRGKNYEKRH